ncbi:Glutathione S-transferase [Rhodovulum sp. P5]|uniref:glutathione S-transferase family protein n=1 Tax=Rhodovulum sp. P5 TaxID=1564506 RepID=UPI0009C3596C|nr:glutathione S-transferase family protein [Rhodovulum sp. P5]ARE41534.1 Glutathione S-transferase [Rhodovulum sp. P5]
MYQLFIGNKNYSSWSLRPWVLMKAHGIPFQETLVPFHDQAAWAAYRTHVPTGLVPLLKDGDLAIWDSLAIAEYLAEPHPGIWPEDRAARAFARSATAEMHSGFSAVRQVCGMNVGIRVALGDAARQAVAADLVRLDALWSEGLDRFGGPYLAGQSFTAADAFFCPVAFRVQTYGLELSAAAATYAETLLVHPAMVEWYEAGLAEPFRDWPHEDEIAAAGTLIEDLRAPASNPRPN